MAYYDLVQQLDDLQQTSDDNSDTVSSIQDITDDHESRIVPLEDTSGQLVFPLSQDTIDLIKELFVTDTVSLVAGTITITDPRISADMTVLYSRATPGGVLGHLSIAAQSSGSITITSSSNTETSTLYYFFIAP